MTERKSLLSTLTKTTFPEWVDSLKSLCPAYGKAGKEIVNDQRWDYKTEIPILNTETEVESVAADGTITVHKIKANVKSMLFYHLKKKDDFQNIFREYENKKGELWTVIVNSLDEESKLRICQHPEFIIPPGILGDGSNDPNDPGLSKSQIDTLG